MQRKPPLFPAIVPTHILALRPVGYPSLFQCSELSSEVDNASAEKAFQQQLPLLTNALCDKANIVSEMIRNTAFLSIFKFNKIYCQEE